eukprot:5875558-Alexandrium_andersonii.AAC.1
MPLRRHLDTSTPRPLDTSTHLSTDMPICRNPRPCTDAPMRRWAYMPISASQAIWRSGPRRIPKYLTGRNHMLAGPSSGQ